MALQYLLSIHDSDGGISISRDSRILELGCGLGVTGMLLHALYDCRVVLTDMPDLIETLQANLTKNFGPPNSNTRITARALDWSAVGVQQLLQQQAQVESGFQHFDVVLNCDCIFEPLYGESWKKLVECQVSLLQANPSTYMLTSVERRKYDGIDHYLEALQLAGVRTESIQPSFEYPRQVELYRLYAPPQVETS